MEDVNRYPVEDDVDQSEYKIVDIRCNVGPRELLMRLEVNEVIHVGEYNLMLLKCSWCTRMGRKQDSTVKRVIHKYNLMGELCGSDIERY